MDETTESQEIVVVDPIQPYCLVRRWRNFRLFLKRPTTYPMGLLSCIALFLNADQNLVAPNLTQIARDFNFTNEQRDTLIGGQLNLGFFIVGGFAAILVGYLTDKVNRRNLFVLVVLIGEFSCFCTLFVKDYWGLFATRAVTGISIGGSNPLIMSMIGDMFDDQSRGRAISFISIMLSLGIALGQSVAGFIGPADALGWRAPFVVIASPTFILAPIYWFTTKDPPRGGKEKAVQEAMQGREILTEVYAEKMDVTKLKLLLKNKTALIAFIQGIPGSIPWGILLVYLQDFLVQDIGPQIEGGISVQQSTIVVLTFGFGSGVGVILGGILADKYWKRDPRLVPLIMSVTTGIGALPIFGLINAPPLSIAMYAGLTLPAGLLATITGTAIRTVLMNVTLPETRGTAFAFHTLFDDIGKGLGPFWVSLLIAGAGGHRVPAFNFGMCGWLVCSALLFVMCFTVLGDLRKLELATQAAMDRRQMNDSEGSALGSNAGIKATDGPQHESTNPRVAPMNDEEAMQEKQREQSSRKSVSEVGVVYVDDVEAMPEAQREQSSRTSVPSVPSVQDASNSVRKSSATSNSVPSREPSTTVSPPPVVQNRLDTEGSGAGEVPNASISA